MCPGTVMKPVSVPTVSKRLQYSTVRSSQSPVIRFRVSRGRLMESTTMGFSCTLVKDRVGSTWYRQPISVRAWKTWMAN
ncbi:hypothetical protein ES703_82368 [subsurface metagenome]